MTSTPWLHYGRDHPVSSLFAIFVAWKFLIVLLVLFSPGIGYDTSTDLLSLDSHVRTLVSATPTSMQNRWFKFVRWDAVYFTHMAKEGHVYEQEWAFGIGLSTVMSWVAAGLTRLGLVTDPASTVVVAGVLLSHITHWLAVVQLLALTTVLVGGNKNTHSSTPFCAAALHIFSPAGIFLSAPSTESPFAFLSISGFLGFVYGVQRFNNSRVSAGCMSMIGAGFAFGAATVIRSNGILAGIPYLIDAITTSFAILSQGFSLTRCSRLSSIVAGGLLVACGVILPHILGYRDYCNGQNPGERRPWCEWTIPSIFTWVQSHYWNVGPFKYWTLSNIPLFLLATPALWLLMQSSWDLLRDPRMLHGHSSETAPETATIQQRAVVASLALPQLVLAVLALTSYHVQIITRISSGYPLWYIWLATKVRDDPKRASVILRWMIIYAMVQAGLYALFLPPA